jgi:glycosyltransferase involved in cell wall biosynthesis
MVASCDVVVAPSFSEGFGSVHTETVAMQKPLITTNVASLPEVV